MIGTRAAAAPTLFPGSSVAPPVSAILQPDPGAPVSTASAMQAVGSTPPLQSPPPAPNVWDRLTSATGGKDSSGAWHRAAGALFNGGGVGDAIGAGAGYVDQQRQRAAGAAQQGFDNRLKIITAQHQAATDAQAANKVVYTPVTGGGRAVGHLPDGRLVDDGTGSLQALGVPSPRAAPPTPTVGMSMNGHVFLGGDPKQASSWRAAGGAPSQGGATFR